MVNHLTPIQLRAHIRALTRKHGIYHLDYESRWKYALSKPWMREIICPPITGEASYVCALHEMGHVVHQHIQRSYEQLLPSWSRKVVKRELEAWGWAEANALTWTPIMARMKKLALTTYYKSYGSK